MLFNNDHRCEWTDQKVEQTIGNLLRGGVILAAIEVGIGGVLYLFRYGSAFPDYRVFRGEPMELRSVSGIIWASLSLHSRELIQLGLLFLMATPVARVVFSLFAFARQGDRMYVVVTSIVLVLLIYSLFGQSLTISN